MELNICFPINCGQHFTVDWSKIHVIFITEGFPLNYSQHSTLINILSHSLHKKQTNRKFEHHMGC